LNPLTSPFVLTADSAIDLQMHTIFSDGTWTPEQLIDHVVREQFGLVAITDHDRVDTAAVLQHLAVEKQLPLLTAVEMSTSKPSAQQPHALVALLKTLGYGAGEPSAGKMITDAGFFWATNDLAEVCDAAHRSEAVCLIAHPGRGDGFTRYDAHLLDELRREVPIDGFEVYYPAHTPEQIVMYREYAQIHRLLTSSGSDSHGPEKKPIKYRAELSRNLLERLGIWIR
jgi:3',5'-nucleoside bisphosphate phosphatase